MVDGFLRKAKDAITGSNEDKPDKDLTQSESQKPFGDVRPASEDPYGDPADQEVANVRPASEDPYGDPADQEVAK